MDARKAFENAASLADPGTLKKEMIGFPRRQPKDRDLEAFHQAEEITAEGFRYKQVLPWSSVLTPQDMSAQLDRHQDALIGFAGDLAAMAIRKQSPRLVEKGLQMLALGGGGFHPKHSLAALAKLYHPL